jgi:hypothetical protein
MAGLDPAMTSFCAAKTWMPGTRPGMTVERHAAIGTYAPIPIASANAARTSGGWP